MKSMEVKNKGDKMSWYLIKVYYYYQYLSDNVYQYPPFDSKKKYRSKNESWVQGDSYILVLRHDI